MEEKVTTMYMVNIQETETGNRVVKRERQEREIRKQKLNRLTQVCIH